MSLATDCCGPCDPVVTNVPGVEGPSGQDGQDGSDGLSVFTFLTSSPVFVDAIATVGATVADNQMFAVGQTVFGADPSPGTDGAHFEVMSLTGTTGIDLRAWGAAGDTAFPFTLGTGGKLTATGSPQVLAAALPTAFTDNSTGTAGNTIAAGVGVSIISIPITLVQITGAGDVLTTYTPGFRFKLLAFDAHVVEVTTGGPDAVSLNLEIGAVNVTGGVIALTTANTATLGAQVAGSAITATNIGTAADTISIEASSVTAFPDGAVVALIRIQNMDTADFAASTADHINDLITALT